MKVTKISCDHCQKHLNGQVLYTGWWTLTHNSTFLGQNDSEINFCDNECMVTYLNKKMKEIKDERCM